MKIPSSCRAGAALMALALGATGCFSGLGRAEDPFRPGEARSGRIQVEVENQNFADATIYVILGGQRTRLGDVTGLTEDRFSLDLDFSLDLSFDVSFVGGRSCSTNVLPVNPGDRVRVRIPASLGSGRCESTK